MGKYDDFAARFAHIKEQTNAPDPTRGKITDPRLARAQSAQSAAHPQPTWGKQAKYVFSSLVVLGLTAVAMHPLGGIETAAVQVLGETDAPQSMFTATADDQILYHAAVGETLLTDDALRLVQKLQDTVAQSPKDDQIGTGHQVAFLEISQTSSADWSHIKRQSPHMDGGYSPVTQAQLRPAESE
jgi:hypothetical protein